jgi:hypothetical protein
MLEHRVSERWRSFDCEVSVYVLVSSRPSLLILCSVRLASLAQHSTAGLAQGAA